MQKLTAKTLRALKPGDTVYRIIGDDVRTLRFVGPMPSSPNYLLFCKGTYQTYVFIDKDDKFSGLWYGGKYDAKYIGWILIKYYQRQIESVRKIHGIKD